MENAYIENLMKSELRNFTLGQTFLCGVYDQAKYRGYECLVAEKSWHPDTAASFYEELLKAGFSEIYYSGNASNYIDSLLAFQKAGATMDGMVELENPRYKREMEAYGESWERQYIPAIKFTLAKQRKVYVVTQGWYSAYKIIAATTDKNVADKIAKKFSRSDDPKDMAEVEEFEDAEILLSSCYFVRFEKDGSVCEIADDSSDEDSYKSLNKCTLDAAGRVMVHVLAENREAAIKIAAERRAEYLAEREGLMI